MSLPRSNCIVNQTFYANMISEELSGRLSCSRRFMIVKDASIRGCQFIDSLGAMYHFDKAGASVVRSVIILQVRSFFCPLHPIKSMLTLTFLCFTYLSMFDPLYCSRPDNYPFQHTQYSGMSFHHSLVFNPFSPLSPFVLCRSRL